MKRLTLKLTIIIAAILCFSGLHAQPVQLWLNSFGGTQDQRVTSMASDNAGNIYLAGSTVTSGLKDYLIVKLNPAGVLQWSKTYSGGVGGNDEATSVTVDNLGNVISTGFMYDNAGTGLELLTIKHSPAGAVLWQKKFNFSVTGSINKRHIVKTDNSGNVYVGTTLDAAVSEYCFLKYSPAGDSLWTVIYQHASVDQLWAMTLDNSGNIYATGQAGFQYLTVKLNSAGALQWSKTYAGPGGADIAYAIDVDNAGNCYVTGESVHPVTDSDITTVKYSPAGAELWVRRYNGASNFTDIGNSIAADDSGNVYVAGVSAEHSASGFLGQDFIVIKYNSAGDSMWTDKFNGSANRKDEALSVKVGTNGIYAAGYSDETATNLNYRIIKYNPSGGRVWQTSYDGPGFSDDKAVDFLFDNSQNIVVTGDAVYQPGSGLDIVTIKYAKASGINIISGEIPSGFKLYQNYPNPFNPVTKIRFEIPAHRVILSGAKNPFVNIKIYGITGKEITSLINESLNPGTYEVTWNSAGLASGVYFYRLTAGEFIETKRMMLVR
jgi:hypothetical protein